MEKQTMNGAVSPVKNKMWWFSIAMLVYWRVIYWIWDTLPWSNESLAWKPTSINHSLVEISFMKMYLPKNGRNLQPAMLVICWWIFHLMTILESKNIPPKKMVHLSSPRFLPPLTLPPTWGSPTPRLLMIWAACFFYHSDPRKQSALSLQVNVSASKC